MSLKFLFIQDSLGGGGAERSNADFWFYLKEQDIDFQVVIFKNQEHGVKKEVISAGIPVIFLRPGNIWQQSREIQAIIKEYQPNLVHSVLFNANIRTRLAKIGHKDFLHIESLVNTSYDKVRLNDPAVNWLKLRGYQLIDAITANLFTNEFHAITQVVSQHYQKALRIPRQKITVIPRGRNQNIYISDDHLKATYKEEFGISPETFVIITTGRQEFQKGYTYLLKALKTLKDQYGFTKFKYIILGKTGHATKSIERAIDECQLNEYVICAGHRYDVEKILPIADVFAFPSVYEGLGVALIEAQAAGLPIICNNIPVFQEVTRPGQNAFLIPSTDSAAWAAQLLNLSANEELRKEAGIVSLKHFENNYLLHKVHENMLTYFRYTSQKINK